MTRLLLLFVFFCSLPAAASEPRSNSHDDPCFAASAAKYNLDPHLLWSIAMVESRGRTSAVNLTHLDRTKSVDLGVMQINSSWLPKLARYGITRERLMTDRCLNIDVGAWILAGTIAKHGPRWTAVGAYNAACSKLKGADCDRARKRYTDLVWRWYAGSNQSKSNKTVQANTASAPVPGRAITIIEEEATN